MLRVENITYKIGKKTLLNNVSATFDSGKLNIIIGPNGAGKSTLIKVICNQIRANEGAIYYGNKNSQAYTQSELAQIRAVLSQSIELTFPLKVWEVVLMGRYPHFTGKPHAKDEAACEEAMRLFDVWELADRNYMTLSGGEKQRVNFARVMAQIWYATEGEHRYLILDEPLTFLDVHFQFQFMHKLISLLKDEKFVVIGVVHDLNLAARFADTILLLVDGKTLSYGNKYDVLTKENIKQAYHLEPHIVEERENNLLYLYFK